MQPPVGITIVAMIMCEKRRTLHPPRIHDDLTALDLAGVVPCPRPVDTGSRNSRAHGGRMMALPWLRSVKRRVFYCINARSRHTLRLVHARGPRKTRKKKNFKIREQKLSTLSVLQSARHPGRSCHAGSRPILRTNVDRLCS